MKAQKVTVTIKVECLSIDVISNLLTEAVKQIDKEYESGKLSANDGDSIEWDTQRKDVEI